MNVSRSLAAAVAVLALGMIPHARANAQVHFGASGGVSFPTGNFGSFISTGYILNGLVEGTPSGSPVELRGEVLYSGNSFKSPVTGTYNHLGFLANAVFNFDKPSSGLYLIGGVGVYHANAPITAVAGNPVASGYTSNNFGVNGGTGYRFALGGLSTFIEGRVHIIATSGSSNTFIPVVFGVVF